MDDNDSQRAAGTLATAIIDALKGTGATVLIVTLPLALSAVNSDDTPAHRGRRPEGCAPAVYQLLQERGPLGLAEIDALLNPNGEMRHGNTTIREALAGLVAAKLIVKTARGVYQTVAAG